MVTGVIDQIYAATLPWLTNPVMGAGCRLQHVASVLSGEPRGEPHAKYHPQKWFSLAIPR